MNSSVGLPYPERRSAPSSPQRKRTGAAKAARSRSASLGAGRVRPLRGSAPGVPGEVIGPCWAARVSTQGIAGARAPLIPARHLVKRVVPPEPGALLGRKLGDALPHLAGPGRLEERHVRE